MAEIKELEKLPEGWKRVRLGEICKIQGGFAFKSENYTDQGIPLIRISNLLNGKFSPKNLIYLPIEFFEKYSRYLLRESDVLIGMTGDLGKICKISKDNLPLLLNQRVGRLLIKDLNYNTSFLFYVLSFYKFQRQFSLFFVGGAQANISPRQIENIHFILPSSPFEQRKIAEILETVDNAIEKTDRIIEKHKHIKQGLMQDLLTKGIDEDGQLRSEETHRFKDSPLGRIPEEWEVKHLIWAAGKNKSNIVAGPFGSNLKVEDYKKEGVPIIRLQNIDENKFIEKDIKYISEKKAKELHYHSFMCGDLVLAKLGDPLGKTCVIPDKIRYGIVVADVVRMRIDNSYASRLFIMYMLNYDISRKQLNRDIIGTTRPRVNLNQVRYLLIPFPPLPEQHRIASILSQIDETIEKEQRYKEKLERIKQGLMEDLLTGKIRVNHLIEENDKTKGKEVPT